MPWWLPEAFPPGWAAGFYDRVIARILAPDYAKVAGELEAAVPPGSVLIDLGTGPAHLPVLLAQRRPDLRIIGIDLTGDDAAASRPKGARRRAALAHRDGRQPLRVSARPDRDDHEQPGLPPLEAAGRVLDEIYRALAPGGRAWLYDNRRDATDADLAQGLKRQGGVPPLWLARLMLRFHGLTDEGYRTIVRVAAARSRFLTARLTPCGLLMRIELEKP